MGGRRSATHGIGDAGEVDEAVAIFVALLAFFRFAILAHPAQSRIAEDDPFESSDRKQISSLDLLDGEQFPPHHHEEVLDLDRLQVFAVRGVRRREVRVVLGQDGVERFTEGDRARVQAREPDQRIFLPGASSVRLVDLVVLCRFDIRRMVGCHDRLGLFRFALGEESLLLLLRLLERLGSRAHVLGRELLPLVLRQIFNFDRKHLAHVRDAVRLVGVGARVQVTFEFVCGCNVVVEVTELGVQHPRDPERLSGCGSGDLVDDGLEGRGGEREPLRKDRQQQVARVLGAEVLWSHFDAERGDNLVDLGGVAEFRKPERSEKPRVSFAQSKTDLLVQRDAVVHGPDVLEDELDKERFEFLAARLHLFPAQDALALRDRKSVV